MQDWKMHTGRSLTRPRGQTTLDEPRLWALGPGLLGARCPASRSAAHHRGTPLNGMPGNVAGAGKMWPIARLKTHFQGAGGS